MNYKNDVIGKKYKGIYTCTKRDLTVKYPKGLNKPPKKTNAKKKDLASKI